MEGDIAPVFVSPTSGIERFSQYGHLESDVKKLVQENLHSLFAETYSAQVESTLADTQALGTMLESASLEAGEKNMPTDELVRFLILRPHRYNISQYSIGHYFPSQCNLSHQLLMCTFFSAFFDKYLPNFSDVVSIHCP